MHFLPVTSCAASCWSLTVVDHRAMGAEVVDAAQVAGDVAAAADHRLVHSVELVRLLGEPVEALRPQCDRVPRAAGPDDLGDVGEAPAQRIFHVLAQQGPGTSEREPEAAEILAHAQRAARPQQPEQLELIQPQPPRQLAGTGRAAGQ